MFRIERWQPDADHLSSDVDSLVLFLFAFVFDCASVCFMLLFSCDDAAAFCREGVFPTVRAGDCRVLVARSDNEIVGTVQLDLATPPNQPPRREIKKLLVHPSVGR